MDWFIAILLSILIISGSVFSLLASVGINRLPDMYCRMHAASKAGTIGSALLLLAAGLHSYDGAILARAIAVTLTAPVAAHLLARSSYKIGYELNETSVVDEMK